MSPLIEQLVNALRCLPGVGPKTAQRMAFQLLERDRERGLALANTIERAMREVKHCQSCRTLCETELCRICNNPRRDGGLLCVVETPADVMAIEQTGAYRGLYFVLMGRLSPLDGLGPAEIGMEDLRRRLTDAAQGIREVIIATNPTVEGEATAHYIADLVRHAGVSAKCTRIAHGVPMGGELEYLDGNTLARAMAGRGEIITSHTAEESRGGPSAAVCRSTRSTTPDITSL